MPTRTRAGKPGSAFTVNRKMAVTFELRALSVAGNLRKAHGQAGSLVFKARLQIMRETIYERAPTNRPLTYRLWASESFYVSGEVVGFTNHAPYAKYRHEMRGISKTFPHLLDSFWASRAMQYTASSRMALYRKAMQETWNIKV